MQARYLPHGSSGPLGLLRKSIAIIGTLVVAGVVLTFSAVLLTLLAIVGAVMFAYLWWKTRSLRTQMREQMKHYPPQDESVAHEAHDRGAFNGEVIEGEATRVDETRSRIER